MSSPRRNAAKIGALLLILSVSACARPVGDFGRAEDDPLTSYVADRAHQLRAPASAFNLTDQEKEMRDRVWRYLISPDNFDWLADSAAELARLGFTRVEVKPQRKDKYYLWLHRTESASSPVRYTRISDDIAADLGTMPAVFVSICVVDQVDRQRGIAVNGLPELEQDVGAAAEASHLENEAVIRWFTRALEYRYASYSYALDHLLVETPHAAAMVTDAKLSDLRVLVEAANDGDFCGRAVRPSAPGNVSSVGSRYLRSETGGS